MDSRWRRSGAGWRQPVARARARVRVRVQGPDWDTVTQLSERIRVREGDRDLKVSKQRAMLKALVAKALKGDARAASLLIALVAKVADEAPVAGAEASAPLAEVDRQILDDFLARAAAQAAGIGDIAPGPAGHQDLDPGAAVLLEYDHPCTALGGPDAGEQARGPRPQNGHVKIVPPTGIRVVHEPSSPALEHDTRSRNGSSASRVPEPSVT